MNISIFGLGYVGAVTAGCLAGKGHRIVGVDVSPAKVESLNLGLAPIIEPGLPELLKGARDDGRLRATTRCDEALRDTEVSIVCVGTPSSISGALDLSFVRGVLQEMGDCLRRTPKRHTLVLRSTMLPGSTESLIGELLGDLERSGMLSVYYYPEFLRESTAVADFEHPSLAVVGSRDAARPAEELMKSLFGVDTAVVNWPTAEMIKYACNAFHATKITFANEVGRLGKQLSIDSRIVMDLLCRDTKLNLSPYYMKPGNPFGGSCLPKDVRALTHRARLEGVSLPLMESLLGSNERHLQSLLGLIMESGASEIVILGLSFKSNTDDLRESSMVEVVQTLLGRGYPVRVFDPALNLAALVGSNKRVIDTKMPHIASLLRGDLASALGKGGLVVVAQKCASIEDLKRHLTPAHSVIDVNGWKELQALPVKCQGFCW
ncbi:MAG: nucleotide sugar dehydrogenase [Verrucomicrobia bacterium]|nr:nucleotide sugar dehydrogenase [Verrucomicrobiota bacterium]MBI3868568.1 nucleotide sugar dehydrogenase [Verrucomicrobiota bacterium]